MKEASICRRDIAMLQMYKQMDSHGECDGLKVYLPCRGDDLINFQPCAPVMMVDYVHKHVLAIWEKTLSIFHTISRRHVCILCVVLR